MADMFPSASALGDSVKELFGGPQDSQAAYYQQMTHQARINRSGTQEQNQGVRDMPGLNTEAASRNSPTKSRASATEDPQVVEEQWMARLIKFAGITNATGVKLGSM